MDPVLIAGAAFLLLGQNPPQPQDQADLQAASDGSTAADLVDGADPFAVLLTSATADQILEGLGVQVTHTLPPEISQLIDQVAPQYGVDPSIAKAQCWKESRGNARAVSPVGAQGLFQIMPPTARDLGISDPFDPTQSAIGAMKYMRDLLRRYDDSYPLALAAYNWGEGHVDRAIAQFGDAWADHLPAETSDYVAWITANAGSVA